VRGQKVAAEIEDAVTSQQFASVEELDAFYNAKVDEVSKYNEANGSYLDGWFDTSKGALLDARSTVLQQQNEAKLSQARGAVSAEITGAYENMQASNDPEAEDDFKETLAASWDEMAKTMPGDTMRRQEVLVQTLNQLATKPENYEYLDEYAEAIAPYITDVDRRTEVIKLIRQAEIAHERNAEVADKAKSVEATKLVNKMLRERKFSPEEVQKGIAKYGADFADKLNNAMADVHSVNIRRATMGDVTTPQAVVHAGFDIIDKEGSEAGEQFILDNIGVLSVGAREKLELRIEAREDDGAELVRQHKEDALGLVAEGLQRDVVDLDIVDQVAIADDVAAVLEHNSTLAKPEPEWVARNRVVLDSVKRITAREEVKERKAAPPQSVEELDERVVLLQETLMKHQETATQKWTDSTNARLALDREGPRGLAFTLFPGVTSMSPGEEEAAFREEAEKADAEAEATQSLIDSRANLRIILERNGKLRKVRDPEMVSQYNADYTSTVEQIRALNP
jgi:hypothetical protein